MQGKKMKKLSERRRRPRTERKNVRTTVNFQNESVIFNFQFSFRTNEKVTYYLNINLGVNLILVIKYRDDPREDFVEQVK